MAKFRFIIAGLNGEEPKGTNNEEVARNFAGAVDYWVIDTQEGTVIERDSDDDSELEEVESIDYGLEDGLTDSPQAD